MLQQNNDDMQRLWQKCLHNTFDVCNFIYTKAPLLFTKYEELVKKILSSVEQLYITVQEFVNKLSNIFKPVVAHLKDMCENSELDLEVSVTTYPHRYPQWVYKYNTKGFPRPIIYCARSRC